MDLSFSLSLLSQHCLDLPGLYPQASLPNREARVALGTLTGKIQGVHDSPLTLPYTAPWLLLNSYHLVLLSHPSSQNLPGFSDVTSDSQTVSDRALGLSCIHMP